MKFHTINSAPEANTTSLGNRIRCLKWPPVLERPSSSVRQPVFIGDLELERSGYEPSGTSWASACSGAAR